MRDVLCMPVCVEDRYCHTTVCDPLLLCTLLVREERDCRTVEDVVGHACEARTRVAVSAAPGLGGYEPVQGVRVPALAPVEAEASAVAGEGGVDPEGWNLPNAWTSQGARASGPVGTTRLSVYQSEIVAHDGRSRFSQTGAEAGHAYGDRDAAAWAGLVLLDGAPETCYARAAYVDPSEEWPVDTQAHVGCPQRPALP